MSEHTIRIAGGHLAFVYDDALVDLLAEGTAAVCRVSHVEYDNAQGGWTADMGPVSGPVLGPFPSREAGLKAERAWLREHSGL
jgi:hypothetical protein